MGLFDRLDSDDPFPTAVLIEPPSVNAARIAAWLTRNVEGDILKAMPAELETLSRTEPMVTLREILEWWNELASDRLVCHKVRVERPATEITKAWKVFQTHETARECLADLAATRQMIEASSFCRAGWFRLEKLLRGALNGGGVPICRVLMDGGYRDEKSGQASAADPRGNKSAADEYKRRFGKG